MDMNVLEESHTGLHNNKNNNKRKITRVVFFKEKYGSGEHTLN